MPRHADPSPAAARPSGPSRARHPVVFTLGLLLVLSVAGVTAYAGWLLYADVTWQSSAQASAVAVADAVQDFSRADDTPPAPLDAVAAAPGPGQSAIADLPYGDRIPADVQRFRITDGGALSVLTTTGALCSGVTIDLQTPGRRPAGVFSCGEALAPATPTGLTATPRDRSILLDWTLPFSPVEDYLVSVSADDGATWRLVDDGTGATSQAVVRPLANGRTYAFTVVATNLVGASGAASVTGSPFTEPSAPTAVTAEGGFDATVAWQAPVDDGGRPVTEYVVTGVPSGSCRVPATVTRCVIPDLPAAAGYSFTVRAVNEAGAGVPGGPTDRIAVFTAPGPPVAVLASPGDRIVLLSWTVPLRDGNTPITDYLVDYRAVGAEDWTGVPHPESTETFLAVPGLVNGTAYEFRVRAVNAVGVSDPPLAMPVETPASVPGGVPSVEATAGDTSATLTWSPPASDGGTPVTGYVVQYRSAESSWATAEVPEGVAATLTRDVTNLVNGTRYAFRVAAVNRMGTGPWSPRSLATPVGPPGPVRAPESVGSLTSIDLTWQPPANDGGLELLGYRVDYRLSSSPQWIRAARVPADQTTLTIADLSGGESYDIRIVAINSAGFGPPAPGAADRPTLAGVIADETPPAPEGLTVEAGDGRVTLTWQESPAGRKSPIVAYTVTGSPTGTCTTTKLTCTITGLTNGVRYSFTVNAANANITGPESPLVRAMPMVYNEAAGGTVTTVTENGRRYRVHTFTSGGTLTIERAEQPFSVLIVGGGGGSAVAGDGTVLPGSGGGVIDAPSITLPAGALAVSVGAGGPAGTPGGESALAGVGAAPAGQAGSPTLAEFSPRVTSSISGRPRGYGAAGTATSGQGRDGRGMGGGGPQPSRGGNGIVIIRYEIAPAQP